MCTIVHVMYHRIEQHLFPLLEIQCVGYGLIIPLASPWQPRYQKKKNKKTKRQGWGEGEELSVGGEKKKKGAKQSSVFLFLVRVNRRLCAALPSKILMYTDPPPLHSAMCPACVRDYCFFKRLCNRFNIGIPHSEVFWYQLLCF